MPDLRNLLIVPLISCLATSAIAHPAIGIVMDSSGGVYFSDTARIWYIAPDGARTVAVPNVHSHNLWLDREGNLYGEHESGGAQWTYRVWKRTRSGNLVDVIPARAGSLDDFKDFSFNRDSTDAMYWLSRTGQLSVKDKGAPQILAELASPEPGWLSVTPDGTAVIADHGTVVLIGKSNPSDHLRVRITSNSERYSVMGVWQGIDSTFQAAVYATGEIVTFTRKGNVKVLATCPAPWRPTAGLQAPDGALWVLETSPANEQRVRRISPSGQQRVF